MIPPTKLIALPDQPTLDVDLYYHQVCGQSSDIHHHLPRLKSLAQCVESVVEFGVRGIVSTWAFLAARPDSLISVDIEDPPADLLAEARRCAIEAGVPFQFIRCDTLALPQVNCDLLFIDTKHCAEHLTAELRRHASGVRRYIAFHDTMSFGFEGEDGTRPGLQDVIERFCSDLPHEDGSRWRVVWHDEANNGCTVAERVR